MVLYLNALSLKERSKDQLQTKTNTEMTEARDEDSFQPKQFWKLMQISVALVFAAILCVVLFKVIMLSKDMEDSRRMLKELSNNLVKTQRDNEDLREELRDTKAKVVNIERKLSNALKIARVRRSKNEAGNGRHEKNRHCHKVYSCLQTYIKENQLNCTMPRQWMLPERKKDLIHVYGLDAVVVVNKTIPDWNTAGSGLVKNITWHASDLNLRHGIILKTTQFIQILRDGSYFVYCNLRVGAKYIQEVSIKKNHGGKEETLFSTTPNTGSGNYDVKLSGLASALNGTKLYVQIKRGSHYTNINSKNKAEISWLFPDLFSPDREKSSTFGMFLVN